MDDRVEGRAVFGDGDREDAEPAWSLDGVVAKLRHSREVTHNIRTGGRIRRMPSRDAIARVLDLLSEALFPSHYGRAEVDAQNIDYIVGHALDTAFHILTEQVQRSLACARPEPDIDGSIRAEALAITRAFSALLPAIRGHLVSDLKAALDGDPAASTIPEILLGYPGMRAVVGHRFAHALHRLGAPLLARMLADITHSRTGIDIHPAATIGPSFFIDHGTGVVIGETAIIGERVRLYQAVTLGARHFPTDASGALIKGAPRHPVVEDDVVIYAGATILGRVTIGRGSTIGGNVWLTESVPAGSRITQAHARRNGDLSA